MGKPWDKLRLFVVDTKGNGLERQKAPKRKRLTTSINGAGFLVYYNLIYVSIKKKCQVKIRTLKISHISTL